MHLMARFKIQFLFIKPCVLLGATFRNNDANNLIFFALVLLFFSDSEYVKKLKIGRHPMTLILWISTL